MPNEEFTMGSGPFDGGQAPFIREVFLAGARWGQPPFIREVFLVANIMVPDPIVVGNAHICCKNQEICSLSVVWGLTPLVVN